jgi:hypothetical protein
MDLDGSLHPLARTAADCEDENHCCCNAALLDFPARRFYGPNNPQRRAGLEVFARVKKKAGSEDPAK